MSVFLLRVAPPIQGLNNVSSMSSRILNYPPPHPPTPHANARQTRLQVQVSPFLKPCGKLSITAAASTTKQTNAGEAAAGAVSQGGVTAREGGVHRQG